MPNPPLHIMEAIQAPVTRVYSRVDIYEADGVTPWMLDAPLIDGNVSVDQGRSERRTVDLTLANQDGRLDPYERGFWYDKVIKPFRGVRYRGVKRQPRILVAYEQLTTSSSVLPGLLASGFSNVKVQPTSDINACYGYDIVVFDSYTGALPAAAAQLAAACYAAGISVLTVGDDNAAAQVPLISTTHAIPPATARGVNPYGAHPVTVGWDYADDGTSGQAIHPTSIRSTATAVGSFVYNSTLGFPMIVEENPNGNGARWVNISMYAFNTAIRRGPLVAAVKWAFTRGNDEDWETQVGEFLIDQISTAYQPDNIGVSGRDYTKRLITSKFIYNTTFTAGQAPETLIRNIALNGGINKFIFPTTGKTVAREFTFDRGTTRWDAVAEIAGAYGYELFFDGQGYMRMQEYKDPSTSPTVFTFEGGASAYVQSAYPEAVMDRSPLAFWRLNEATGATIAKDSSGRGVDAQYSEPNFTKYGVPGALADRSTANYAVEANRPGAGVNLLGVPNDPRLALSSFTLEFWVRLGAPIPTNYALQLLNKGEPGFDNSNYAVYVFDGVSGIENKTILYASPGGVWQGIADGPVLTLGKWHHLVFTYTNGVGKSYLDGVLYNTTTTTGALPTFHGITSLQLAASSTAAAVPNRYAYVGVGKGGYTIQSGDYLEYDVRINTASEVFYIDLETTGGVLRNAAPADQNGVAFVSVPAAAVGGWATRRIPLTSRVGSTITDVDLVCENDAASSFFNGYFRNINIKNSGGVPVLRVWNQGDPTPTGTTLYSAGMSANISGKDPRYVNSAARHGSALDEVVVYERALSAADIKALYDAGRTNSRAVEPTGSGNIESYTKTTRDSRIYNHVVVVGGASDTTSVSADVQNTNPSSPTNVSRLGDRVYEFVSSFITTQAQALDVANSLLSVHALEEYELSMSTIVLPWLEVGEIVVFRDPKPNAGDPARFLLSSFTIPLKLGKMNPVGKRIVNSM